MPTKPELKAKQGVPMKGEYVTRAKDNILMLITQYWECIGRPAELSILNKQVHRLVKNAGIPLLTLLMELEGEGRVKFIMLSSMKRLLVPGPAWNALELDAKSKLTANLELEYVTLRSKRRVNLPDHDPGESNGKLNPNNEPFFTNLNRANPNNEVSDAD